MMGSMMVVTNPICSVLLNPLANLRVMRSIVLPGEIQPTYKELVRNAGAKLITVGMPAFVLRNAILGLGFIPRIVGNNSLAVDAFTVSAAIAFSHPIELARVLIVN